MNRLVWLAGGPADGLTVPVDTHDSEVYVNGPDSLTVGSWVWVYRRCRQPFSHRFSCRGWIKAADVPDGATVVTLGV